MKKKNSIIIFIVFTTLLGGCSNIFSKHNNDSLIQTVKEFSETADQCLYDTRDSCIKYNESRFCNDLGKKSLAYLSVGGGYDSTPLKHEILYERGIRTAWMAKAISASNCTASSIW